MTRRYRRRPIAPTVPTKPVNKMTREERSNLAEQILAGIEKTINDNEADK